MNRILLHFNLLKSHLKSSIFILLATFFQTTLYSQLSPFETHVSRIEKMNYYLYSPTIAKTSYPLVVFLHGGGESGNDITRVAKYGLPKLASEGRDFPFYIFAPQNPYRNGLWDDRMIDHMVSNLIDSLNVDVERIYLVGMSRGGNGVWRLAINNPARYAAMISICAASIPMPYLKSTASMPVWFFHGEKDTLVPVAQSIRAYEMIKEVNDDALITIYPESDHECWTQTFANDDIYEWLLSHKLTK